VPRRAESPARTRGTGTRPPNPHHSIDRPSPPIPSPRRAEHKGRSWFGALRPAPYAVPVLRVPTIVADTEAEGPGRRLALWAQGCTIRCPGCCNPEMFTTKGGTEMTVDDVLA